jgi:hypothetical protein
VTIGKGGAWGRQVARPSDLVVARDDADLAARLQRGRVEATAVPVAVSSGDLARTLGSATLDGRATLNELPIDMVEVRLGGVEVPVYACAHVVIRSPWWRGGWLRGRTVVVMNAEFIGRWDVAPRGHPNDGRVEVFEVDSRFGLRQRLAARRRSRTASHVPHPLITARSVRAADWSFESPMAVLVDGVRIGTARHVAIAVVADAAVVYA